MKSPVVKSSPIFAPQSGLAKFLVHSLFSRTSLLTCEIQIYVFFKNMIIIIQHFVHIYFIFEDQLFYFQVIFTTIGEFIYLFYANYAFASTSSQIKPFFHRMGRGICTKLQRKIIQIQLVY